MEKIKIEKNIPVARKKGIRRKSNSFPFEQMDVGDSFYVEISKGKKLNIIQSSTHSSARSFCWTHKLDWKFTTRAEGKGFRMWRIK